MIAHVVLFRPRPNLSADDAGQLVTAFERALQGIPSLRRAHIGRRITIGRGYEQLMRADFPYAAILEFDDVAGLRAYLEHPAHGDVGGSILQAADEVLVYDFEMGPGPEGLSAVAARP